MKISKKRRIDKARYREHKNAVVSSLGGKCAKCGSTKNLEVDHIVPQKKKFEILASMRPIDSKGMCKELKKCQLLCKKCHINKTITERGQTSARGRHGTISTYRYCRCKECTKAHSDYCAAYNAKARAARQSK